jgi:hypothetical protein
MSVKKIFFVSTYSFKQLLFSLYWHILVDMTANFWKAVNRNLNINYITVDTNKCLFLLLISVCLQVTGSLYVPSQVYMTNYMSELKQITLYFRVITEANEELVHIYYCALNFRNVMTATGKLSLYGVISDRLNQVRKKTFVYSHLLVTMCMNSIGLFQLCF